MGDLIERGLLQRPTVRRRGTARVERRVGLRRRELDGPVRRGLQRAGAVHQGAVLGGASCVDSFERALGGVEGEF